MERSLPTAVIEAWHFAPTADARSLILPDGCRDLILHIAADGKPACFVSALADTVQQVDSQAGELFFGFRFHPGSLFDESALLRAARQLTAPDPAKLQAIIEDHVGIDHNLAEVLAGLSASSRIDSARHQLGVSERSLERFLQKRTGHPPSYWRQLARVRRAAASLTGEQSLAAVAAEQGYADQAHLSRAFRKWFGTTPSRFRNNPKLLTQVATPGFC